MTYNFTVATMVSSTNKQPTVPSIPVVMSDRIKEQSNQSDPINNIVPMRLRASSSSSLKRLREDSEGDSDVDTAFLTPKYHNKKEKKLKQSQEKKSYTETLKSNSAPKVSTIRRQANWGTSTSTTSAGFAGAVPELFISNCRDNPEEGEIKAYLESKMLNIVSVKMMSQPGAFKKSFKIKVSSFEDYDKLIVGGQYLPRAVAVKKFIYPRSVNATRQWAAAPKSQPLEPVSNLTSLVNHPPVSNLTSLVNHPSVSGIADKSDVPINASHINEFIQHSETELSTLIKQSINVSNNIADSGCPHG